ncbi:hypothetical protein VTN02DRAFT_2037 [Thermoascus thermophilus]
MRLTRGRTFCTQTLNICLRKSGWIHPLLPSILCFVVPKYEGDLVRKYAEIFQAACCIVCSIIASRTVERFRQPRGLPLTITTTSSSRVLKAA